MALTPEQQAALDIARDQAQHNRKSDLISNYSQETATLLRTLNHLRDLSVRITSAGELVDEDFMGATSASSTNVFMTPGVFNTARGNIDNLITVIVAGGNIGAFTRDTLEAIVPGGATL